MSNYRKLDQDAAANQDLPDNVVQRRTKEDEKAEELLRKAEEKQREKERQLREKRKSGADKNGPKKYLEDTGKELRAVTWPTKTELLKWCLIVLATVGIVALFAALIDNFVATPLMYAISGLEIRNNETFGVFDIALVVAFFAFGLGSIVGVMLHQGGETEGLSDTVASKLTGGSGQAQKNLDRITLACIILFVVMLLLMMVFFPQGTIVQG